MTDNELFNKYLCKREEVPENQMIKQESEGYELSLQKLLMLQYETNQRLIQNTQMIYKYIAELKQPTPETVNLSVSDVSTKVSKHSNQKQMEKVEVRKSNRKRMGRISRKDSDYEPEQQQEGIQDKALTQTKNIPKNFGRSIMAFCKSSKIYVEKVLRHCNMDSQEFYSFLQQKNRKITTIMHLKSLWMEPQSGLYAQPLRIISQQYLRKYSLAYIFNSRIERKRRNTKYREKLLQALKDPFNFTNMKDF